MFSKKSVQRECLRLNDCGSSRRRANSPFSIRNIFRCYRLGAHNQELRLENHAGKHVRLALQLHLQHKVLLNGKVYTASADQSWCSAQIRQSANLDRRQEIDDPYAQRVFSEMLKDAIREAEALFDHPHKQYTLFSDLEDMVEGRQTPNVPDEFGDNSLAKAFYGAFVLSVDQVKIEGIGEAQLVAEACFIDTVVKDAVRAHSINPGSVEAQVRKALLPRLFSLLGGLDAATKVVDQIVETVRAGDVRNQS